MSTGARSGFHFRRIAVALLVILVTTAAFHRQILFAPASHLLSTADIVRYFLPIHDYIKSEVFAGRLPLWNPYIYAGTPLAANPQVTLFYPPAWINLFVPVVFGQRLLIALHAAMALGFQYQLLRRWGASRPAATVGAMPWAFSSYMMANAAVGHLTMLFTAAWLPAAIYCVDRAIDEKRKKWLMLGGMVLAVQVLAGEPQNGYYTAVALTVFAIARSYTRENAVRSIGGGLARLAAIALIASAIAAIQLLPTAELARHSDRAENTNEYATAMSYPPNSLIGFLVPWRPDVQSIEVLKYGWRRSFRIITYWELASYVGVLTLVLAGVGLVTPRGRAPRAAKFVLLMGTIIALGSYTPLYSVLLDLMPGLRLFRVPARAMLIVTWGLSAMAGLGADWVLRDAWRSTRWRAIAAGAVAGLIAGLFLFSLYQLTYHTRQENGIEIITPMQWSPLTVPLALLAACLVLLAAMRRMTRAQVAGALIAFTAADLLIASPTFPMAASSPDYDGQVAMFRQFAASPNGISPGRVDFPSVLNANAAMTARVENVNGYWPLSVGRFYHYVHEMRNRTPRAGDRHELSPSLYAQADELFPLKVLNVRWTSALEGPKSRKMRGREHPAPVPPRAWIVGEAESFGNPEDVLRRMKETTFDPLRKVLLESPALSVVTTAPKVDKCDVHLEPGGTLIIRTATDRAGYLVLSQVSYPGWRATIDGTEVPIVRADYLISAIELPAGEHRVRFAYRPASVRWGAIISALACVAAAGSLGVNALRGNGSAENLATEMTE